MKSVIYLIKHNLIRQMRSYNFLLLLLISIFLSFLCVPGINDGYEIFYLGGVRGIYNSAWLGSISVMLPVILLWLPGFYLLRSQISEDKRLKIGEVIAAAPVSKFDYVAGKCIANFSVLMSATFIFTITMMIMQFIRHESFAFNPMDYIIPLVIITAPYLLILSSLTILFDVISFLKGTLGNILIFFLWVLFATVSVALPGNNFDLFGLGYVLNQMSIGAKAVFPNLSEGASFGYYPNDGSITTFQWNGLSLDGSFLTTRLLWIGIAILIIVISSMVFNGFKEKENDKVKKTVIKNEIRKPRELKLTLSPVKRTHNINFLFLIKNEIKIMLSEQKIWWYVLTLASIVLSAFVVVGEGLKWISLIMLLPMGIWSQMGCRERYYNITQLIKTSCPWQYKWFAGLISGLFISLLISSGILIRFALDGAWTYFYAWIIGAVFIPALAFTLGIIVENRKMFEGIYIALFYFGPINNMASFDFMGVQTNNSLVFLSISIILLVASFLIQFLKENHIIKISK